MIKLAAAAAMSTIVLAASAAVATPITYFGEDTNSGNIVTSHPVSDDAHARFFANLISVTTENFESFATNVTTPITINFATAGTASLTGSGRVQSGSNAGGQFPVSGTQYVNTSGALTLTFNNLISAFGFYADDVGDQGAILSITLTNASNVTTKLTIPHQTGAIANGSLLYYAFYDTDDSYKSIAFTGSASDNFGFDDFSIGLQSQVTPIMIPEPGTGIVVGCGVLGLLLARRRLLA